MQPLDEEDDDEEDDEEDDDDDPDPEPEVAPAPLVLPSLPDSTSLEQLARVGAAAATRRPRRMALAVRGMDPSSRRRAAPQ